MIHRNMPFSEHALPWGIFLAGCLVFLANLDLAASGDAIYYANIIDTLRFDQLTVHQGYYLIGYVFAKASYVVAGLPTDQALAVMNALFGAGALSIGFLLLRQYLRATLETLLGVLMLLLCQRFFVNSTSAEVYIVQAFFIWSAYLLFERRRYYLAGAGFGLAMWVSPLTLAYGLVFPTIAWLRGDGIRSLLRFAIPVLLIYVPFLSLFYRELLWGIRGVIVQDELRDINLLPTAQDVFKFQIKHYSFLNLLFIPALFALRQERRLLLVTLAAVIPNIYVISQLRGEDNVFILALDIFIVCWLVIGWRVLRVRALTPLAALALLAHVFVFSYSNRTFFDDAHENYRQEMRAIGRIAQETDNSIVFMDWDRRMAFVYYNRNRSAYPIEQGYWYDLSFDIADIIKYKRVTPGDFNGYETYYVLESYAPSPQASVLLGDASLRSRYEVMSEKRRIERFLDVECQPFRDGMFMLYKCKP